MIRPHEALLRYPGFLMFWIGRRTSSRFANALEPLGLTPRDFGVLNVVAAAGPVSQQELGQTMGIDPSTVVALIDDLESRGFVERRRHADDRRRHALHLTDEGKATLSRGRRLAARLQEQVLASLGADERDEFTRLLRKVAEALDETG